MKVPNSKSGYMNLTACAIFDGDKIALGLSSGFEFPGEVIRRVLSEGINVSTAFHRAGFTEKKNLRFEDGVIGVLTKGRLPRKDYAKEAIRNALIHIENSDWF
jgi:non-canonical (house-cleaning) NTP pyrophosphatase